MKPHTKPSAFTAIELVAATALSTLLMVALMMVTASIGRSQAAFEVQERDKGWSEAAVRLIHQDLLNATAVHPEQNRLVLEGHCGLDEQMERVHLPVMVVYELNEIGDRKWLVRRQTPRQADEHAAELMELVLADVEGFEVQVVEEPESSIGSAMPAARRPQMPSRVQVTMESSDPARQPVEQTIVLR
jgi:type II secretory pathway component PulJ